MSANIYAGNLQRTGEYQTKGLRTPPAIRWTFSTQGHIHFPPLVAHGRVYIGSNDGSFYALGTHTGVLQWRFETDCVRLFAEKDPLRSWEYSGVTSVQLTETTAYLATAGGGAYGLDLHTGQETWKLPDWATFHIMVVDEIMLGWNWEGFRVLNLATKNVLWSAEEPMSFHEPPTRCPTISDQMLFYTWIIFHNEDKILAAYDLLTKQWLWQEDSSVNDETRERNKYGGSSSIKGVIPVVDGTAYFPGDAEYLDGEQHDTSGFSGLLAVEAATGTLQWAYEPSCDPGPWVSWVYTAVAGELVYLISERGDVDAVERSTHQARWTRQSEQQRAPGWKSYAPPSLADGVLYLAREDGLITALDALTGQQLWTFGIGEEIATPCTIADGVVYVAAGATVYALH